MSQEDTINKVEEFTDKYVYDLPKLTVVEYAVLAVVCFWLLRKLG